MLAAVLTMLVMVGGLAAIYVMFLAPAVEQAMPPSTAVREDPSLPPDTKITPFDSPQAQAIEQQAIAAAASSRSTGCSTRGNWRTRTVACSTPTVSCTGPCCATRSTKPSRRLLLQVMGERELRLHSLKAAAARADEELKFDEAAQQWEAVQALTLDNEPLNARARTESARLRQRAAQ